MGYVKDGIYYETRSISVRVEVLVDDTSDESAREIGRRLAEVAKSAIEVRPVVRDIEIASYVLRKR